MKYLMKLKFFTENEKYIKIYENLTYEIGDYVLVKQHHDLLSKDSKGKFKWVEKIYYSFGYIDDINKNVITTFPYKILFFNTKLNKLDHNSFYKQDIVRKLTENEIEEFEYLKMANKYNL